LRKVFEYSHLGGSEILKLRFPEIDQAIDDAIVGIGSNFRTFESKESSRKAKGLLYAPKGMNRAFREQFSDRGFKELKRYFDIEVPGWTRLRARGHKQIDFARDRLLFFVILLI
jgi:hypothetical protein